MKVTYTVLLAIFIFSCASTKSLAPAVTQTNVERASKTYPGVTLAEINEGKVHYEAQCDKCHKLKDPRQFTEPKLQAVVPKMVVKANKKAENEAITPSMQTSILKYMVAMSKAE